MTGAHRQPRTVELHKADGRRFVFRFNQGDEELVRDALLELVHRRDGGFDWFDAAVISNELGRPIPPIGLNQGSHVTDH